MNEKIREHVLAYMKLQEYKDLSNEAIIELIRDCVIWTGNCSSRRHWNDCFSVARINNMLIGFNDARTTGDDSPYDKGWEFDPETICEAIPYEYTETRYKKI